MSPVIVCHAGGGESALSKLPSTKSSNKYDDEPERTTRRVSGGYAGIRHVSLPLDYN